MKVQYIANDDFYKLNKEPLVFNDKIKKNNVLDLTSIRKSEKYKKAKQRSHAIAAQLDW